MRSAASDTCTVCSDADCALSSSKPFTVAIGCFLGDVPWHPPQWRRSTTMPTTCSTSAHTKETNYCTDCVLDQPPAPIVLGRIMRRIQGVDSAVLRKLSGALHGEAPSLETVSGDWFHAGPAGTGGSN